MTLTGAVLAALGSALLTALSSVLHHRAGVARGGVGIVLHPVWVTGTVVATVGLVLHTVALRLGQLSVVQPLLVSGLLFALPLAALFDRRRVRVAELAWSAVVVLGLGFFLLAAQPAIGRPVADPVDLAQSGGTVLLVGAAAVAVGVWWRPHRAALWAFAGGSGYGLVAALLKTNVGLLGAGTVEMLTSWPFYALLVIGPLAIGVNQAAFNAGPLASSLPMLTIANPLVAVILGAVVFGEVTASVPARVVGQVVAFSAMTIGVVALTRSGTAAQAAAGAGHGDEQGHGRTHVSV